MTGSTRDLHDAHSVSGERTAALVDAARSVQSRLSSLLAAGLMITLGLAALTWYYAHALTRQSRSRQVAQSTAVSRAQGEMPLPSLGRIGRRCSQGRRQAASSRRLPRRRCRRICRSSRRGRARRAGIPTAARRVLR